MLIFVRSAIIIGRASHYEGTPMLYQTSVRASGMSNLLLMRSDLLKDIKRFLHGHRKENEKGLQFSPSQCLNAPSNRS